MIKSDSQANMNNSIDNTIASNVKIPNIRQKTSLFMHEQNIEGYNILEPRAKLKAEILPLEMELFELMNLEYGKDVVTEDVLLVNDLDNTNNNYYVHLVRNGIFDPNKENFLLLHGFLSSWTHYIIMLPYLLKKYNVLIPDNIGMGLSSRPKVNFTSAQQCQDYFIEVLYILIKKLFLKGTYNIKKDFYIGGHSLGGFIVSRYILKYPIGIKKVFLMSPAGITDWRIPGTDIHREMGCVKGCCMDVVTSCLWPFQTRMQNLYRCCCLSDMVLNNLGTYNYDFDIENIKRMPDGSEFKLNKERIYEILKQLIKISLDYPDDIYQCVYYIFHLPPPAAIIPVELEIYRRCMFQIIFAFGEVDWMDRTGALRLEQRDPNRFKVYTVSKSGHSFSLENPKEVQMLLDEYF